MKLLKFCTLTVLIALCVSPAFSQKKKVKYGKIKPVDFALPADFDTSAVAVVLAKKGAVEFTMTSGELRNQLTSLVRVLILKKEGLSYANFTIPLQLYKSLMKDEIRQIKGCTYNMVDGKVEKTKLKRSAVVHEEFNEYRENAKLSLENVKVGSIIELKYIVERPFWNIQSWRFQENIPTIYNEFEISVPEYYYFSTNMQGYLKMTHYNKEVRNGTFDYASGGINSSRGTVEVENTVHTYVMENSPAFKSEPYMDAASNYMSLIEHELVKVQFPQSPPEFYSKSWKQITQDLLKANYFGKRLKSSKAIKEVAEKIKANTPEGQARLVAAYEWVKAKIAWTGRNSYAPSQSISKTIKEQKGNVADVNFTLIQLLRELGYTADPVVLSTRANGIIHPSQVTVDQLNYVIAKVTLEKGHILMDASEDNCPVGLLPFRTLNGRGRLISTTYNWENLQSPVKSAYNSMAQLKLDETGSFTGKQREMHSGYLALNFRDWYDKLEDEEAFMKEIEEDNPGMELDDYEVLNADSIYKKPQVTLEYKLNNQTDMVGDLISFKPLLLERIAKTPFKLDNREYPINFGHTWSRTNTVIIQLPNGFEVQSIPQSIQVALPNNSGVFQFSATVNGTMMTVRNVIRINKDVFIPTEYLDVKKFYDMIVAKHAEQVVLKRVAK